MLDRNIPVLRSSIPGSVVGFVVKCSSGVEEISVLPSVETVVANSKRHKGKHVLIVNPCSRNKKQLVWHFNSIVFLQANTKLSLDGVVLTTFTQLPSKSCLTYAAVLIDTVLTCCTVCTLNRRTIIHLCKCKEAHK